MTLEWAVGALAIGAASFVMGLAGFGIALVALAILPYVMPPQTAVVLVTIYAFAFALAVLVQLRRELVPRAILALLAGTLAGAPLGVWVLTTLPAGTLKRLIGAVLVGVVLLELRGLRPRLVGRGWELVVGALAGALGGAVGTPGPPVIVWAASQPWSPRAMKAHLQAFFTVNQGAILIGYWWAGLVGPDTWRLVASLAPPALGGVLLGVVLFSRVDPGVFRRIVFGLLLVAGAALLVGG